MSSSLTSNSDSPDEDASKNEIRADLRTMSFEEIMKLKEQLGAKVYKEAVLGVKTSQRPNHSGQQSREFKRVNKNRPREATSKRPVPFLGSDVPLEKNKKIVDSRDPRFDDKCGLYDTKDFKENYKFITEIREKEIAHLKRQLKKASGYEERRQVKSAMQRLINKNLEDRNWHVKQDIIKEEQREIQKAVSEGRKPHYSTKKERRAKELVKKFEELKKSGGLNKHLEKRRKRNAAKDRKKICFD